MDFASIPNELLADIFLRLPTVADIICASAACVSFRRLVADRSFLRRFRKLHAPPLLGFLDEHDFNPAVAPHPSAPAASAIAIAADFSFAFLPEPARHWSVRDVRVLLDRPRRDDCEGRGNLFKEIVVCDPLYRQYFLLPPIPEDLTASVENPLPTHGRCWGETFLLSPGDEDEATDFEETSFRVIWMAQCEAKPVAFVFCSITEQWQAISSLNWSDLVPGIISLTRTTVYLWRQYAYGCFYWTAGWSGQFLVLDTQRMEFCMADRPTEPKSFCDSVSMAMVEAGDGMPGLFVQGDCLSIDENEIHGFSAPKTFHRIAHRKFGLHYTIRRNNGGGSSQWKMERTISIGSSYLLMGSTGRHLLLYQYGSSPLDKGCFMLGLYESSSLDEGCFTLDVKTFQLEWVCAGPIHNSHAYCNFPPSILSSPTVSSARRRADRGVIGAVPVPELEETGPGGVQGPVLTASAQVPNPLFVVGNDAKADRGVRGKEGAEAGAVEDAERHGEGGEGVRGDEGAE